MFGRVSGVIFGFTTFLAVFSSCGEPGDVVRVGNHRALVLVAGQTVGRCVDDAVHQGRGTIAIENLVPATHPCPADPQLVVFREEHAVERLASLPVTSNPRDVICADAEPPIRSASVRVWVLKTKNDSDSATQRKSRRARADVARAHHLFNTRRCGVVFHATLTVGTLAKSDLVYADCDQIDDLLRDVTPAPDPRAFNVFYTTGRGEKGWWCPDSGAAIVTRAADNETLAHEIGHAYALQHFGDGYDNVMVSGSYIRTEMTAGQCFRVNFDRRSLLALEDGGARTLPLCDDSAMTRECPTVNWPSANDAPPGDDGGDIGGKQGRRLLRRWLECEECTNHELDKLLQAPPEIKFFERAAAEVPSDQARHLHAVYPVVKSYGGQASHHEVNIDDIPEREYVEMYEYGTLYRHQIRVLWSLVQQRTPQAARALDRLLKSGILVPEARSALVFLQSTNVVR